jgi:hypothetical protein
VLFERQIKQTENVLFASAASVFRNAETGTIREVAALPIRSTELL